MPDVAIRPAVETDLPALTDIYNHYIVNTPITFDLVPFVPAQRRQWFDDHTPGGPIACSWPKTRGQTSWATPGAVDSGRKRRTTRQSNRACTAIPMRPPRYRNRLYAALFEALDHEDVHRSSPESAFRIPRRSRCTVGSDSGPSAYSPAWPKVR